MDDLDSVAQRIYEYLGHIDFLRCTRSCAACGHEENVIHPVSEKSRRRLARDMARAAVN